MTEKDLAEDYRMVLHEAKSMGCSKIKALYNIPIKNMEMIVQALEEVQQYRAIGTQEECRAAVEKQKAKKMVIKNDNGRPRRACGGCGCFVLPASRFCSKCGQKLDWSDEE